MRNWVYAVISMRFAYDITAYWMAKDNVIFQDRDRYNVSGAETTHRGIELTASWRLSEIWSLRGNGSYARHRYDSDMELLGLAEQYRRQRHRHRTQALRLCSIAR